MKSPSHHRSVNHVGSSGTLRSKIDRHKLAKPMSKGVTTGLYLPNSYLGSSWQQDINHHSSNFCDFNVTSKRQKQLENMMYLQQGHAKKTDKQQLSREVITEETSKYNPPFNKNLRQMNSKQPSMKEQLHELQEKHPTAIKGRPSDKPVYDHPKNVKESDSINDNDNQHIFPKAFNKPHSIIPSNQKDSNLDGEVNQILSPLEILKNSVFRGRDKNTNHDIPSVGKREKHRSRTPEPTAVCNTDTTTDRSVFINRRKSFNTGDVEFGNALNTSDFEVAYNEESIRHAVVTSCVDNTKSLSLCRLALDSIPDAIFKVVGLNELILCENNIVDVSTNIFNLRHLTCINFRKNKIQTLPNELGSLKQLQKINLSGNNLSKLPMCVCALSNLRELHIGWNGLRELPSQISQLQRLDILDVSGNALVYVSEGVTKLTKLSRLDLGWNCLENLPTEIERLQNLDNLGLRHNKLEQLPESLQRLSKLRQLCLRGNLFSDIPSVVSKLPNLSYLDMSDNNIMCSVPMTNKPEALITLNLSGNFLTVLPYWICMLPQLKHLYLSKNFISLLPDALVNMRRLQTLDISRNLLTHIPDIILELEELQSIDLSGNGVSAISTALVDMPNIRTLRISKQTRYSSNWALDKIEPVNKTDNGAHSNGNSSNADDVEETGDVSDSVPTLYVGNHYVAKSGGISNMHETHKTNPKIASSVQQKRTLDVFSYLTNDSDRKPVFL